ncbi:hypothetical protein EDB81DRAFT_788525 [Dactylonectria macrodidyma]|uniref:Secreted protein n=1 Tax=Dactylonectria macrodidyma TaxID=307937 RepID=A0A9P9F7T2_9HYPO|nr:hypothetical protein EDB81DRAFT_788525 [Dactylonectria macrodidyma]
MAPGLFPGLAHLMILGPGRGANPCTTKYVSCFSLPSSRFRPLHRVNANKTAVAKVPRLNMVRPPRSLGEILC